ncbi:MAG: ABC transporter permease [Azospirillaceae bacterium]|nr:ABC transporter permease [Azospirillaceae bacterium]
MTMASEAAAAMMVLRLRRIYAMELRYWYLLRRSWPRLVDLVYWPTIQMLLWGFINSFLATNSSWVAQAGGVLIAAVLLWDVLFRSQIGMALSFLEEMWSRNLGHLFVSPLTPGEWVVSMMLVSLMRTVVGVLPAALLAMPVFGYSVFDLGLPLLAFFINLMVMGWWLGLIATGLILRWGLGAENLAWMAVFILAPVSAVYYPVSVLPPLLQGVAWLLPSSHVFEGMRAVQFHHTFPLGDFALAVGLNLVYLAGAAALFLRLFHQAQQRGALLVTGE